ncbi:flagellar basal body P-ring formation chaperone FlgA [Shewanella sp. Isolate11]|uniref:flagellar basal body P-ring formation chaperone FlgA n=1 Tax=Shewanella sp. Isolate11 TaxID=2908530 RepID=UPI001EFCBA82|nr:flagellar basal body P-ring formation chaperone FlgA [Shewanella sp. Isolate11]MCG9697177.1 flagellar basal body P-ring formation protein FlgA [Shewanella sp. Isolate11]
MNKLIWSFLITLLCFPHAWAKEIPETPSLSAISDLAIAAIQQKLAITNNAKVVISPQSLDTRLSPPRCNTPPTAEIASDREIGRNNTVKISCNSPDLPYPWQIYISVRVDILYPVVIAIQTLGPGDLIAEDQIKLEFVEQTSLRGQQFDQTEQVIGTRVKRRIAANQPIYNGNLCFVCKGDMVSIYARSDNVQIKTVGEALRDGNLGDRIQIKNSNSQKIIEANVIGIGEVEVRM